MADKLIRPYLRSAQPAFPGSEREYAERELAKLESVIRELVEVSNVLTGTVAGLPSASLYLKGRTAFATNGRRSGEGAGAGSGVPVWSDQTNWRTFYDNSVVAA
jgi:hypothetical protein